MARGVERSGLFDVSCSVAVDLMQGGQPRTGVRAMRQYGPWGNNIGCDSATYPGCGHSHQHPLPRRLHPPRRRPLHPSGGSLP